MILNLKNLSIILAIQAPYQLVGEKRNRSIFTDLSSGPLAFRIDINRFVLSIASPRLSNWKSNSSVTSNSKVSVTGSALGITKKEIEPA